MVCFLLPDIMMNLLQPCQIIYKSTDWFEERTKKMWSVLDITERKSTTSPISELPELKQVEYSGDRIGYYDNQCIFLLGFGIILMIFE